MAIDFITKNIIADYIKTDTDACTYFTTWLKEFRYKEQMQTPKQYDGITFAQLGASTYSIKYQTNIFFKTAIILFFGNQEEEIIYRKRELDELRAKNPGAIIEHKIKSTTVVLTVPKSSDIADNEIKLIQHAKNIDFFSPIHIIETDSVFATYPEYEKALQRAVSIFNAKPETDEFEELTLLLPLIKNYEREKIKFPKFNAFEAVKLRMKNFKMGLRDLVPMIGSEEDIELFFAGKKLLTDAAIARLYKTLALRFPVDLDDFIME